MSTTPTPQPTPSKLSTILAIIDAALKGLSVVPIVGGPAALADIFVSIIQNGMAAYEAEAGQPLDLTKIPLETPVP